MRFFQTMRKGNFSPFFFMFAGTRRAEMHNGGHHFKKSDSLTRLLRRRDDSVESRALRAEAGVGDLDGADARLFGNGLQIGPGCGAERTLVLHRVALAALRGEGDLPAASDLAEDWAEDVVGVRRVGAGAEFIEIALAVAVFVERSIGSVIWVEAVERFPRVLHAVAVAVREGDSERGVGADGEAVGVGHEARINAGFAREDFLNHKRRARRAGNGDAALAPLEVVVEAARQDGEGGVRPGFHRA